MLIVDRFEGNKAVIEDGEKHIIIEKTDLPQEVKEGDVIILSEGRYTINKELTQKRRQEINRLQDSLWE